MVQAELVIAHLQPLQTRQPVWRHQDKGFWGSSHHCADRPLLPLMVVEGCFPLPGVKEEGLQGTTGRAYV